MSNIYDNQIKEMQRLINYGRTNETVTATSQPIVEYHSLGADGKTYGIIREGHNFYIKVAPKKDTQVLAEDYDYIGGFNNKKANEYPTYTIASKQFDLKMKALNEAYNKKVYSSQYAPIESAEWQVNETKEMRRELDRYNQIVENVNRIMEGKDANFIGMAHEVPEAPAKKPSQKKVNSPFTEVAVAPQDKDLKYAENQFTKSGPYSEGGEVTNKDMESDKRPSGKKGEVYTEKGKPNAIPNGKDAVASKTPSGGKAVKVNEGRTIKINEEQVLAWSKSKDFMDKSKGTKIGSSAPFSNEVDDCADGTYCEADTEAIHEDVAVHNTDNQNSPKPGVNKPGHNGDPFEETVNEAVVDSDDVEGLNDDDDVDIDIVDDVDVDNIGFEDNGSDGGPTDAELDTALDGIDLDDDEVEIVDDADDEGDSGLSDDDLRDDSFYTDVKPIKNGGLDDPYEETDDEEEENGETDAESDGSVLARPGSTFKFVGKSSTGEPTRSDFGEKEGAQWLSSHFGGKPSDFRHMGIGGKYEFNPSYKSAHRKPIEPQIEPEEYEEPDIDTRIDYDPEESFSRRGDRLVEVTLNDFGKHPAYRKRVMTLPPNKEINRYGRDWNDDSAKGEKPFGLKIGSSAPYTDEVVDMLTDAILSKISKKKV